MCQRCVEAVKRYWPDLPQGDYGRLLWSCTAFPAAKPETVEQQVRDMAERSGCDLGKAMKIVDEETNAAMAQARAEPEE